MKNILDQIAGGIVVFLTMIFLYQAATVGLKDPALQRYVTGNVINFEAEDLFGRNKPLSPEVLKEQEILSRHLAAKYRQSPELSRTIVRAAYEEAEKRNVSPLLVLAVAEQESSLRPEVVNSYGAMGLMQVVPRWHQDKLKAMTDSARPVELLNPVVNIQIGTAILAEYLKWKKGDLAKALAQYSGGARDYYEKVMRHKQALKRTLEQQT